MASLNDAETMMITACDWLASQQAEMIECLKTLVDIDSNSYDKAGTDAVADVIVEWLEADGIDVTRTPRPESGDILEARLEGDGSDASAGHVLMMGHRDTVLPTGTVAERGFPREGDTAFGPGVADMKAGLVMNVFVLRALKRLAPLPFPARAQIGRAHV